MIYTRPDYYKEFVCKAGACPDTCCAGWQIVVDEKSMEKYRNMKGDYVWKVMSCVDWEENVFRQDEKKRCAFLNPDNLCDLYSNAGEDSLCKTCREYPRHTEEFEGVREISLSLSCPEVARILMERMTPVTFLTEEAPEIPEDEEFLDFDFFFFSILEDARQEMIGILQDRQIPLKERGMRVLAMAHDMQGRINRQEMFGCEDVIQKYKGEKAKAYIHTYVTNREKQNVEVDSFLTKSMFQKLEKFEILRQEWKMVLRDTQEKLFSNKDISFEKLQESWKNWKKEHSNIDIHLEQILVYFLFTYFPGAVYDGEVFAKVQMSVYCTWMVELLWMAEWITEERQLSMEKMTKLLYQFSREIEHSDDNLKYLDKIMEKKLLI